MVLQPGDVLYIYCVYSNPPKNKYAICVCPHFPLFFFINTYPRRTSPDAQVYIEKTELSCLRRDSYINTAAMFTFAQNELDKSEKRGVLTDAIRARIIYAVSNHDYLPLRHKEIALKNLRLPHCQKD